MAAHWPKVAWFVGMRVKLEDENAKNVAQKHQVHLQHSDNIDTWNILTFIITKLNWIKNATKKTVYKAGSKYGNARLKTANNSVSHKKRATKLLSISSPNIDRFKHYFTLTLTL